ncbi:RICIN domain-containing protein [Streptomyces sp. NPDC060000]|uniref:RICIN domain-containing protein n=1 Tax=Streptomyces sp. NPDC060000 TaxID=3347031 RepID=UPI003677C372
MVKKIMTACALTAGLLAAGGIQPAQAASHPVFVWKSQKSGRCVDADLNTIRVNGTKVQLWDCNLSTQQNWVLYGDGTIRSSKSGKCLDADLNTIGANGTKVQLWDCNGSLQQKWTITGGSTGASHQVLSRYSNRCVDADLNTIGGNGTKVQLWDCNGSAQQRWSTLYW